MKLNISRLINDLGGATAVAKQLGKHRTAPYGWVSRKKISSDILEQIKKFYPEVKIDEYFEQPTKN
jgi:hypothetical protein|tara:strand:+ start:3480 stop:3677 length:198 start_codon:yes stop_codon:yes gene_type:complete